MTKPRIPADYDDATRVRIFEAVEDAASQLGLAVFVSRLDGAHARVEYLNELGAKINGRPLTEIIGKSPYHMLTIVSQEAAQAQSASREETGDLEPAWMELEIERPDGVRVPIEVGAAYLQIGDGMYSAGFFRDITIQRAAVEALRRSDANFRALIENAPDGVVILRDGRIVFCNSTAATLLGAGTPAAALGQPISAFLPADDMARAGERIAEMMRTGVPPPASEYGVRGHPQRTVEIKSMLCEWENAPAVLAFARDVTARKALQVELIRADRLSAVGSLAAAVAHEINNPLTYAQLSLQRIERELASGSLGAERVVQLVELVRTAMYGTERVATIVRDLRTFARDDDGPPGPVDLIAVVDRALKMADHDLRHRARLTRRFQPVPHVEGHGSRLEQVFLNLLINAIQAMPEGNPTSDEIVVEIAPLGEREVRASVHDTGSGIAADIRDRIFDPFFTTKPVGEGTGLGLAVCKSIIEGVGGRIALVEAGGKGTRIEIVLRTHRARAAAPVTASPAASPIARDGARLSILVIDDEALVRRVIRMSLEEDHDIHEADGGAAAIAALDGGRYDVVLCDLMMPELNGMEIYLRIRERYPGLERRIVFITGGAFVPRLAEFLDSIDNPKLLKPFDEQQLLDAVRYAATR